MYDLQAGMMNKDKQASKCKFNLVESCKNKIKNRKGAYNMSNDLILMGVVITYLDFIHPLQVETQSQKSPPTHYL